jgi:predicted unusual protein kinase regulating ubiquinone biosynthesis (AarF/ABC1/UbiB family)
LRAAIRELSPFTGRRRDLEVAIRHNGPRERAKRASVSDIPQRRVARTAKLASLPLGVAGRATIGLGKRISGRSADEVSAELQARTAEQLFTVLGELKGGAMKLGQALSVFEAALPEETAAPYREALTRLQEAAPPMPVATVRRVLDEQFGRRWPDRFQSFDEVPAAAASIGQVHRAVWADGREVAVKLQYPGAGPALMADFTQLSRLAWLFARMSPGLEVKPLLAELKARVLEELDYTLEADAQREFAAAYADDADIAIPRVVASAPKAIVTEWLEGTPLSRIIAHGTIEERDHAGSLLALLHYSAPERARLLHADPHPGNFRLLADGRLGVVDFGAVARLPEGSPEPLGRLTRMALDGDGPGVMREMRAQGFIRPGIEVSPQQVMDYLGPIVEPLVAPTFTFTREWMRRQANRLGDPRREEAQVGRLFNLPPSYLLIHRVTLGSIGVLCQLGATAPYRSLAERWQPGFARPAA